MLRTWAKVGQTPTLRTPTKYEHLSVASALTLQGRLLVQTRQRAFTGASIVAFLKHLLRQIPGQIVLVRDGARLHSCQAVREFLAAGAAKRLRLVRLPAYAPELNPDENVWRWLKRQLGNVCCKDFAQLERELHLAIRRLRRPEILRACFEKAGLRV